MPVQRHLRFHALGGVEADRKHDFGLVIDAVAFRMPEAQQRRFRRRKMFLEYPPRRGLQSHGVVDVQAAVVLREIDMRHRLYLFRSARGVERLARHQFDFPELRTQFGIIGESDEIDSVPLIFEVVEEFGMSEQAGVDDAPHQELQAGFAAVDTTLRAGLGKSADRNEVRASWPGLTRPSILFARIFRRLMDTRVKPAYDAAHVGGLQFQVLLARQAVAWQW